MLQRLHWVDLLEIGLVILAQVRVIKNHIVWHFWNLAPLLVWGLQAAWWHKVLFYLRNLLQYGWVVTSMTLKLLFKVGWRKKLNTNPTLYLTLKMPVKGLFYSTSFDNISHLHKTGVLIRSWFSNNFWHIAVVACHFICQPRVEFDVLAFFIHWGWFKPDV